MRMVLDVFASISEFVASYSNQYGVVLKDIVCMITRFKSIYRKLHEMKIGNI